MNKANMNPSQKPSNSNQSVYSSKVKKVKKSGCGCGKNKKRT